MGDIHPHTKEAALYSIKEEITDICDKLRAQKITDDDVKNDNKRKIIILEKILSRTKEFRKMIV